MSIYVIHEGRALTPAQYEAATGRQAPAHARRQAATATVASSRPSAGRSPEAIAQAERDRISEILSLPAAKDNRVGAEALALGSSATVGEAAAALARHADRKAAARTASTDNMRRRCGLPEAKLKPLTAGAKSMLKITARSGTPDQRKAAIAKLAEHGLNAQGR